MKFKLNENLEEALTERERKQVIDKLIAKGYSQYYNWKKFSDGSLLAMLYKNPKKKEKPVNTNKDITDEPIKEKPTCPNCGSRLNDMGTCPECDDNGQVNIDYKLEGVINDKIKRKLVR